MRTIWVFGDQCNRALGAMADADPARDRILLVRSEAKIRSRTYHRQRLHLVLAVMARFADELRDAGFEVDERDAGDLTDGFRAHVDEFEPDAVVATEPNSRAARRLLGRLGVDLVRSNAFLCHHADFAEWAAERNSLRMEDFYRSQRRRLGYLMDGDEPAGGRWNFDAENREPPPEGERPWPDDVQRSRLDDLDRRIVDSLPDSAVGAEPIGVWATSRRSALARLRHFVADVLPHFGPHEDAMLDDDWHLAHSLLSPYLNLGLLLPGEVCDRVEEAYRDGSVPIASAEGFIRQVIGWREYVWGLYWLWPDHGDANVFGHERALPPAFRGESDTAMACLTATLDSIDRFGWTHHIPRLMVLANLSNLAGVEPSALLDWMSSAFVDAQEWVMVPNVIGMGLWADGGRMATKPYVSGGAYLSRMSDHCDGCRFDPKARTGADACPFTTLYWDFLARNRDALATNHRMKPILGNLDRLTDLPATRARAAEVIDALLAGTL